MNGHVATRQRVGGGQRRIEHPLLGTPRRDLFVTAAVVVATVALFVLFSYHGSKAGIERLDRSFLRDMEHIRSGPLTFVAKVLNVLGLAWVTAPIRIAIAGFLAYRRRWWHAAAFVSAMLLSEILIGPLKAVYDRPRPLGPLVHTSGASFPSGHAVAATVTVLAAVIALLPEGPGRYRWGALAVAFSMLMAISRAYLAAHWLSDAVAGVLLGTSCALIAALVVHSVRERGQGPPAVESEPHPDSG
jgi:membrane-associated phospholipid phosphatase